jgi:hypothetical protein
VSRCLNAIPGQLKIDEIPGLFEPAGVIFGILPALGRASIVFRPAINEVRNHPACVLLASTYDLHQVARYTMSYNSNLFLWTTSQPLRSYLCSLDNGIIIRAHLPYLLSQPGTTSKRSTGLPSNSLATSSGEDPVSQRRSDVACSSGKALSSRELLLTLASNECKAVQTVRLIGEATIRSISLNDGNSFSSLLHYYTPSAFN